MDFGFSGFLDLYRYVNKHIALCLLLPNNISLCQSKYNGNAKLTRKNDAVIRIIPARKAAASEAIFYQILINLYLRDCSASRRRLDMQWIS